MSGFSNNSLIEPRLDVSTVHNSFVKYSSTLTHNGMISFFRFIHSVVHEQWDTNVGIACEWTTALKLLHNCRHCLGSPLKRVWIIRHDFLSREQKLPYLPNLLLLLLDRSRLVNLSVDVPFVVRGSDTLNVFKKLRFVEGKRSAYNGDRKCSVKDKLKESSQEDLVTFRFAQVSFGVVSSPFLLVVVIRYLLSEENSKLSVETSRNFYVNNVVLISEKAVEWDASYNCTERQGWFQNEKVGTNPLVFLGWSYSPLQWKPIIINMDLCTEANELAHSIIFKIILAATIIISTTAIFTEVWIMLKTTNRVLIHRNTRILIIVHQLLLILHCIARIFTHTYVLVAYQKTHIDQCGYMMIPWECFILRTPITLTLLLNGSSIPAIVMERTIATCFSSRYEKFGKSIAIILIVAQFAIGIGNFLFLVSDFKLFDSKKVVYCSTANDRNSSKSAVVFGFL
ncbi:hypothetical protein DINM_020537 [Dirofilaria immitis]|nr:hypothetical protein [Dirofilaria immitis]